jgi:hypothetical protein
LAGADAVFRAAGDPDRLLRARIAEDEPQVAADGARIARTAQVANPGWPAGLTGHARIYGARHSLGFLLIGVPFLRLFDDSLWSRLL